MELIRGTTPYFIITCPEEVDLSLITAVWVYIFQYGTLKVDKVLSDMTVDHENHSIKVHLSQDDMLNVKRGKAKFQMRILINEESIASIEKDVFVHEIYKGGIITP